MKSVVEERKLVIAALFVDQILPNKVQRKVLISS